MCKDFILFNKKKMINGMEQTNHKQPGKGAKLSPQGSHTGCWPQKRKTGNDLMERQQLNKFG